ncbi:TonB-dependent receptor [Sphingopyxis sp. EG6]|uniref:TonB-dependent receptor n=1 Tax=Sphingopyxis sp. EG6 TaxID=1874061 RepID=UPI000DC63C87|nr:TonB-dependent receptor [Sphingopyxis sp. EG6]BBB09807.1 TonB-dependent receptor-like protein [Sphingopyxis sp. EG6]
MKFRHTLAASCALIPVALLSTPTFAQSTGSVDFDEEIVVTGVSATDVVGISSPDTSKAKAVLGQEVIERQNPGQTILDTINLLPGVNFTNNDAYGSAGGQLTIRGFSADRISLTFDGVPLNDSGNYAIYSNQQLDPELIEQVNVNLGSTDVDSPTAAATGSTVNYRTLTPTEEFGVKVSGSAGEYEFMRIFGLVNTGEFTPWGTRAFLSASTASNNNPFNNYGRLRKKQFNGRIWQPLGDNGDFISVAGHYNVNRNNFFGSVPLRLDANRVVGSGSGNRFPIDKDEREYDIAAPCTTTATIRPGVADTQSSCGTEFDRRYNPSNTGNIRGASKFTLTEGLVLTVDPSYQYVKANGGGTVTANEGFRDINPAGGTGTCGTVGGAITAQINCSTGYLGGQPYFGRDLNGDGDILDRVSMLAPSQTQTHRYGVIANLRWDINDFHTVRVGFTYDRARHRQTGEVGLLQFNGEPFSVFPVTDNPQADATGVILQKRDRLSYAILTQVSGEYRGEWADGRIITTVGIRAPFFKRDLNNNCFTSSDTGFLECFGSATDPRNATYATLNPTIQGPQQRVLKYDDILPNVGLMFKPNSQMSVFANYSKGLQVPGTDALYNAFFFAPNTPSARPSPETSDNFDLGFRYRTSKVQAQISGWFTKYNDRLASAFDPETDRNLYRNLGRVDKYGIDGSVAYQPIPELALYVFGSWMKSEIKDNVQSGECTAAQVTGNIAGCTAVGQPIFVATAGKRESGAPKYSFGGTVRGTLGPVELGITGKRTGGRFIYDTNLPVYGGTLAAPVEVYPNKTNAYWLVNLDARLSLEWAGLNDKTFLQLNVYNLFDSLYVGNYTPGLNQGGVLGPNAFTGNPASVPNAQIGAPRTISATLTVGF